ncbi:DUF305 domain-containing protein [Actinokineospora iranica]|uniref:Uncharacterized conserved protein, DUF305 family n=1 Tax=Actinokineospora iranica TaxID=1271860 RepID=A0A1G6KRZ6_9PSEU|nr:DUF305 domain-containing protein [Actinokineospora iranica]SDC33295.1 Uncharacterized conserved protein, DUF305 family [Actinokineospora iranica]
MSWLRVACGAVVLVFAAGVAGCANEAAPPSHPVVQPGRPGEPNKTLSAEEASSGVPVVPPNQADVEYVQMMVVHHGQALTMAELAPDRAQDAALKGLADRILDAQRVEMDMLNGWLERNGKPKADQNGHGGHADMPGMATPDELAALRAATGAEFDRSFLRLMIKHHEGAVAMANAVQKGGADVKVQEMADHVIAEQTDEIGRMRAMLGP